MNIEPNIVKEESKSAAMKSYLFDILCFVLTKEKAKTAAESLYNRYSSMSELLAADIQQLERVPNMTKNAAILIKLIAYTASRRAFDRFKFGISHTEDEICEFIKSLFTAHESETVYIMFLDSKDRVIGCEFMGEGTVNASDVYPRKLLESAMRANAKTVIVAHNHPYGTERPSREDIIATQKLYDIFASAEIKLLYHIVVSRCRHSIISPTE